MKDLLFSICIPVRDDLDHLKQCLHGLGDQDLSDCEIFVCDDGSACPLTPNVIQLVGTNSMLISQAAKGPSAARNHMAQLACGRYLFFLDADTAPHSDMIQRARNIVAAPPDLDALYGSYDDQPADLSLVSCYKNLLHHHSHHQAAMKQRAI